MTLNRDSKGNEQMNLEVLGDLTDEALEGELADEELGRLLVAADFTEGDGSGPEAMGLLDTAGRGCCGGLACRGLGSELLTGCLAYSGRPSGCMPMKIC